MGEALSVFNEKIFNAEVFRGYMETLPNPRKNELIKCKAIRQRPDLVAAMSEQAGGNYITTALEGLITNSKAQNYDGVTDIKTNGTKTFKHSRVVVGRSNAWVEKDFSFDITGGKDFLENVAEQIADYWDGIDQETIVAILTGVFKMTGEKNEEFINSHTHDITNKKNSNGVVGNMDGTSLNTCMQRACGDNKVKFSLTIMHSFVSTNLENLNLLANLKYTDKEGIERELGLATLNGRLVIIDDTMPTEDGFFAATADTEDALKVIASGTANAGEITVANVKKGTFFPADVKADDYVVAGTRYITFVLGDGALEYTDCGVKVPYEPHRDPYKNGGEDSLISRQRKCFAPFGISFTMESMATQSPTDAELAMGENWELVSTLNAETKDKEYIEHKTIPIARIISRG